MKVRRAIVASMLMLFGLLGAATPAHAGLWCENADRVDEAVSDLTVAGSACRTAVGVVCAVADKAGGACLA
jgi:hypothetical protein